MTWGFVMNDEIFGSFGFLLMRVVRAQHSLFRKKVHTLGLYRGQPPVLFTLQDNDGMSNSDLAESLEITPATLTNKVKRMEKAGLVTRKRDQEDERVSRIYLTDKGRGMMEQLHQNMIEMEAIILEGFSSDEVTDLKNNLLKIIDNIEKYESKIS